MGIVQFTPLSANAIQAVDMSGEFGDAPPSPGHTAAAWGGGGVGGRTMIRGARRGIPKNAAFDNFS